MKRLMIVGAVCAMTLSGVAASACTVSKSNFMALRMGASYDAAASALGCAGDEIARSEVGPFVAVMYMWNGSRLGANMNAMFQNDKLVSKAQFGLTDDR